jgi:hypothetical protein
MSTRCCLGKSVLEEWLKDLIIGDGGRQQIVLVACGSFSPITYLHLRLFGRIVIV